MTKTRTILAGLLLSALILTNCGGKASKETMNADAKKVADVLCKIEKLPAQMIEKAASGDTTGMTASLDKAKKESDDLIKEMEGKYTTESEQKQFMSIVDSLSKQCK
jgi:hypothetical protein